MIDHSVPAVIAPDAAPGSFAFHEAAILGTRMNVTIVADGEAAAQAAALAARAEVDRLDLILSGHRDDSELAQLNRAQQHQASAELFAVVAQAERWRAETGGAFSGRLGRVIDLWREGVPDAALAAEAAAAADAAVVVLDGGLIRRPDEVIFALDGLAKGWIIDRALERALASPGVCGAMVEIGGDLRCAGASPGGQGWLVHVADPLTPFDNAPDIASLRADGLAVATSGRGVRDRVIDGRLFSPTLSPFTGWPVPAERSVTVVAERAADADVLATAMLAAPERNESLVKAALVTDAPGARRQVGGLFHLTQAGSASPWSQGWQALATFTAPRRQLIRDPGFRSPYMVMWITDTANRPVRTLLMVGKRPEWQRDNNIWWALNRANTGKLISTRSMSTSGAGVYNVFWDGVNDAGQPVAPGSYILHVETSRERGKHTYRQLPLDFSKAGRFKANLPPTEEGGGLVVSFDRY